MAKTDLDTVKNTAIAESFDYGDYAHEGFEGTTVQDLSIPFINVLQSLSPEVQDETVPGAKAGDLLNSVTKEILAQPLVLIPVHTEEVFVEWVPRTKGGGLVGRHEPNSPIVQAAIKANGGSRIPPKDAEGKRVNFKSPAGNDLIETHYAYCLIMNEEGTEIDGYCVLSFSSAKIKAYKDWRTAMFTQKGRPPIFANRSKISTLKQKNDSGTYFIYSIAPFGTNWRDSLIRPDEAGMKLLEEAKGFRDMINNGLARADFSSEATGTEAAPTYGQSQAGGFDDETPF